MLVTVLFTDIVDATVKLAALGDRRCHALLHSHHALVRRALTSYSGREIDTAGDGLFAVFDRPAWAIRCACTITGSVRSLGNVVRAGFHTGECEVIDDKFCGLPVHIGARVATLADAGEVLCFRHGEGPCRRLRLLLPGPWREDSEGRADEWHLYAVEEHGVE